MRELFELDNEDYLDEAIDLDQSIDEYSLDYKATIAEKRMIYWKDLPKHSLFIINGDGANIAIKTSANRFVYLKTHFELGDEHEKNREMIVENQKMWIQRYCFQYDGA